MWGITGSIVAGVRKAPEAFVRGVSDLQKIPGLNIPPLVWKIMSEVPEYWDKLPEDQKQALFNALVAAGTKAANEYAKKPS